MKRQVGWFLIVGGTGFLIDAGGLLLLNGALGVHPLVSRIPSFVCAMLVTFMLNRHFTFQAKDLCVKKSFAKYVSAVGISQGINFLIYTACIYAHSVFFEMPVFALIISSGISMFISFSLSRFWVFKGGKT